jgi:hypothetical protein
MTHDGRPEPAIVAQAKREGQTMVKRLALLPLLLGSLTLASGCVANRATATASPDVNWTTVKTFYVVRTQGDTRGTENLIRDDLVKRGFSATGGPELPKESYKVDAIVTYVDRWMWDITMYMLELTVTIRNPANNFPLASGNSYHTSLARKSPEAMVDEVLTNIFNRAKPN